MQRKTGGFFLTLAVFNIIVAVIPPCVGGFGAVSFMKETKLNINNKELGPELEKHIAKNAPLAKVEAFAAVGMNTICCLMLIGGAVGLFMSQGWARWLCVAGGLLLIFALLIHDIYQIFFYRPVLMTFIDQQVPVRGALADATKWGTTVSVLAWSCTNPLIMLYLFVMSACMALMSGFHEVKSGDQDDDASEDKIVPDEEDDDDEEARRRRRRKKQSREDD
jgi:cytochrome c biogenesis protein CcdA